MIWDIQVSLEDLVLTGPCLSRHGYEDKMISMSALVPWELMGLAENLAKGPGKDSMKLKIAWTTCLKIFIEVAPVCIFDLSKYNVSDFTTYAWYWK